MKVVMRKLLQIICAHKLLIKGFWKIYQNPYFKSFFKTMKTNIIIFLTIIYLNNVFAQNKGLVKYGFIESLGIGDSKGIDSNSYLLFNSEMSYFVTAKDSLESQTLKQTSFSNGKKASVYLGHKTSPQGDQVVFNPKKNTIWSNLLYRKQIYVKEVTFKINWRLEKETKKIGNFNCSKATCNFRGRDYIVWYAKEIPANFGPWKLNGLPGLILEAYDIEKNVLWYFKSIEYPSKTLEKVSYLEIPKNNKLVTYNDFKKFQKIQIEVLSDKQKVTQKSFKDVIFIEPELKDMFIECE